MNSKTAAWGRRYSMQGTKDNNSERKNNWSQEIDITVTTGEKYFWVGATKATQQNYRSNKLKKRLNRWDDNVSWFM